MTKSQPTPEQLDALREYATKTGKNWREDLLFAWSSGKYNGFAKSHLLQQLRNQCGPSWLAEFEFPQ